MAATILSLDQLGVAYGFTFGLILTVVSGICTGIFMLVLDRGRTLDGAGGAEVWHGVTKLVVEADRVVDRLVDRVQT